MLLVADPVAFCTCIIHNNVQGLFFMHSAINPAQSGSEEVLSICHYAGTLNVISAAAKAKTVKRIVVTGSIVSSALPGTKLKGTKITEDDWNEDSTLESMPYAYSKVIDVGFADNRVGHFLRYMWCVMMPCHTIRPL